MTPIVRMIHTSRSAPAIARISPRTITAITSM
jgi:hypothetical protein